MDESKWRLLDEDCVTNGNCSIEYGSLFGTLTSGDGLPLADVEVRLSILDTGYTDSHGDDVVDVALEIVDLWWPAPQ